jgi:hypothetical protein
MSKITLVLAAAASAFALAGASAAAAAAAAIDVPAQVFPDGQAGSKPVTTSNWRPVASSSDPYPDRGLLAGRSFGVKLPVPGAGGAEARLPLMVHVLSSEEECHDDEDINGRAQNQDQDFIRGGEH